MELAPRRPSVYPRSDSKIDVGKALKFRLKGLTMPEIAAMFQCSKQAVFAALKPFMSLLPAAGHLEAFRDQEAGLLDGVRLRLLPLIIDQAEQLKTRKAYELATTFGILFDKSRILQGLSTQNISILSRIIADADKLDEPAPARVIEPEEGART